MRTTLIIAVLCFCFCGSTAFADDAAKNTAVQGNQGYVYGTPSQDQAKATTAASSNGANPDPIGDIVNAVNKLDAWVQRNLW
jgi:hypothetical protein